MRIRTLELGGMMVTIAAAAHTARAQAPAADDPPAGGDDEQVSCPAEPGATSQACPQPTQQPQPPPNVAMPTAPEPVYVPRSPPWYETFGFALSVGGGVDDFARDQMRNTTSLGGAWNVRLTFGTRSYFGFEASYIGSAQSIDALGLPSDAVLIGNGAQGALRLNGTVNYPVQPFAYGGGAYRFYSISMTGPNLSDVRSNDNVFEVPVGGGIAAYLDGLMLDARGEYRFAWGADSLVFTPGGGKPSLDRWAVSADIGYEF